jgi:hypothetical protein
MTGGADGFCGVLLPPLRRDAPAAWATAALAAGEAMDRSVLDRVARTKPPGGAPGAGRGAPGIAELDVLRVNGVLFCVGLPITSPNSPEVRKYRVR